MKNQNNRNLFLLSLIFSLILSNRSSFIFATENPYNSGGTTYGDNTNSLQSANLNNANLGSGQGYYSSPYPNSLNSSPVKTISNSTYSQPTSNSQISPYQNSVSDNNKDKPWDKMETWLQNKKIKKPTTINDPEKSLASGRIEAGKARIKALEDKEKLNKHIADSEAKTQKLRREAEQSEQQAIFLENQIRFQESSLTQPVNNSN